MGVKKFKPETMLYSKLLSDNADYVRRSAAKTVKEARGVIHKSESLVAQSHEVVERAERDLKELKAKKAQRDSRNADLTQRRTRKG